MGSVTLTTLRARARERADMTGSSFVADAATGLDAWINEGCQAVHEKLVGAYGDEYALSTAALATVVGTANYALPAGMLKLYGVDLTINGQVRTLRRYNRAERNVLSSINPAWYNFPKYRVAGGNLNLSPTPTAVYSGNIYYAPEFTLLVNAGDTTTFPNGWEKYAVLYAAIQAMLKEESDVRALQAELRQMDDELARIKDDRDAAFPASAVDLEAVNVDWGW